MRIIILEEELESYGIGPNNEDEFPQSAIDYMQDNYFNGADKAVSFIGGVTKDTTHGFITYYIFDLNTC